MYIGMLTSVAYYLFVFQDAWNEHMRSCWTMLHICQRGLVEFAVWAFAVVCNFCCESHWEHFSRDVSGGVFTARCVFLCSGRNVFDTNSMCTNGSHESPFCTCCFALMSLRLLCSFTHSAAKTPPLTSQVVGSRKWAQVSIHYIK